MTVPNAYGQAQQIHLIYYQLPPTFNQQNLSRNHIKPHNQKTRYTNKD